MSRLCIALAVGAAMVLVGCGGGSSDSGTSASDTSTQEYGDELQHVLIAPLGNALFNDFAILQNTRSAQAQAALAKTRAELVRDAYSQLTEITPPDEFADVHQRLVNSVQQYLTSAEAAAADPNAIFTFIQAGARLSQQITAARKELAAEGVSFPKQ